MITEIRDINPRNWLTPFQKNTIPYLLKMGLFYHLLGLVLMYAGSQFVTSIISGYQPPDIPVSVSLALSSGVLEESVFFGIPFYLSGNPMILLGSGVLWSVSHLFNGGMSSIKTLSYAVFLFTIPHIFFSLRVWASGKGWFAIAFHCMWNVVFLLSYCSMGLRTCGVINDYYFDLLNAVMAISAAAIVYLAYQNKKRKINRYLYFAPIMILLISLVISFSEQII